MHANIEIMIGCVLVGFSLAGIVGLTLWSRRIIEQVARSDQQTARHILRDRNGKR